MSRAKWLRSPDGLSESARKYWDSYASGLHEAGELKPEKAELFKNLCRLLAVSEQAASEIARDGVTIETKSGTKKPHPACAVLLRVEKQLHPLLQSFGLGDFSISNR